MPVGGFYHAYLRKSFALLSPRNFGPVLIDSKAVARNVERNVPDVAMAPLIREEVRFTYQGHKPL
jgi:hypothetical protein